MVPEKETKGKPAATGRERAAAANKARAERAKEQHKKRGFPTVDGSDWKSLEVSPPQPIDAPSGFVWVKSGEGEPELKPVEEVKPRGKSTGHFWTPENNYVAPPIETPDNLPEETDSTIELPPPVEEGDPTFRG